MDQSAGTVTTPPVFIPVRDRVSCLDRLVSWFERAGFDDIWLIDNASTYPALVEYLESTKHHVVRLADNLGHRSPWVSGTVQRHAHGRRYVVSDPDVLPDDDCPLDVVDRLDELLDRYADLDKAGLGLRIDDLPDHYPLADEVRRWETRFWSAEVEPGVYRADVDTTFALYRALDRRADESRAVRTGPPCVARHLPWYADASALSDEDRYYRDHADRTIANWDRDVLPLWKSRWLHVIEDGTTSA